MPEEKTPFQHETPMADETMFARLCRAAWNTAEERRFGDVTERWMEYQDGNAAEVANTKAIVRVLLAELRAAVGDAGPSYISVPGVLTAAQRDAMKQAATRLGNDAVAAFIDAILAEAGGSGG